MPYYTYQCTRCGDTLYLKMKMTDSRPDPLKLPCAVCNKDTDFARKLDSFAFSIKGEKWS